MVRMNKRNMHITEFGAIVHTHIVEFKVRANSQSRI